MTTDLTYQKTPYDIHGHTGCSKTHGTNIDSRYKYTKQTLFQEYVKVQKVIVFEVANLKVEYGLFFYSCKGKSSN